MPDAATALSGLQTTHNRRHDKRSASGYSARCRMRLPPYPAYKPRITVGLISAAHQAIQRTSPDAATALSGLQTTHNRRPDKRSASGCLARCRVRLPPYPAYKPRTTVGLISAAHQAIQRNAGCGYRLIRPTNYAQLLA
ncbi:hypothetical protein C3433_08750 [Citrobacter freundii]|nr:hypothetical protein C3433_08750 [Citrobacter freundii]